MAKSLTPDVVHRITRGRSGLDSNTKTDSGCFVDELEKQDKNSTESSPNARNSEARDTEREENIEGSRSDRPNLAPQNVNAMEKGGTSTSPGEYSTSSTPIKNENQELSQKEDFYCLYYSDSPEGSLRRNREDSEESLERDKRQEHERAERPHVTKDTSGKDGVCDGEESGNFSGDMVRGKLRIPVVKKRGPPVAPKPQHRPHRQSDSFLYAKDPLLAELQKLGAAVGRDYGEVFAEAAAERTVEKERRKSDSGLLQTAMQDLDSATSVGECLDKFGDVQKALKESLPDTLERNKGKVSKPVLRKKSAPAGPEGSKTGFTSKTSTASKTAPSRKSPNLTTSAKKAEPQKTLNAKKSSESLKLKGVSHVRSHMNTNSPYAQPSPKETTRVRKVSPARNDTSHERSHTNTHSRYTPPAPKEPTPRTRKVSPARSNDTAKVSTVKDAKGPSGNPKSTMKKTESNMKSNEGNPQTQSAAAAKRSERLELRSRRRLSGDLSSIPEDEIMGAAGASNGPTKGERTSEKIPLAGGEEDDDLDLSESIVEFDADNSILQEAKNSESLSVLDSVTANSSKGSLDDSSGDSAVTSLSGSKQETERKRSLEILSSVIQTEKELLKPDTQASSQSSTANISSQVVSNSVFSPVSSLGKFTPNTSYNTADDIVHGDDDDNDDDVDKSVTLDETTDTRSYQDPEELVDMTFGSQIDQTPLRHSDGAASRNDHLPSGDLSHRKVDQSVQSRHSTDVLDGGSSDTSDRLKSHFNPYVLYTPDEVDIEEPLYDFEPMGVGREQDRLSISQGSAQREHYSSESVIGNTQQSSAIPPHHNSRRIHPDQQIRAPMTKTPSEQRVPKAHFAYEEMDDDFCPETETTFERQPVGESLYNPQEHDLSETAAHPRPSTASERLGYFDENSVIRHEAVAHAEKTRPSNATKAKPREEVPDARSYLTVEDLRRSILIGSGDTSKDHQRARTYPRRQEHFEEDSASLQVMAASGHVAVEDLQRLLPLLQAQPGNIEDHETLRTEQRKQALLDDAASPEKARSSYVTVEDLNRLFPLLQAQPSNTGEEFEQTRTGLRRQDHISSREMPVSGFVTEEELKRLLPLLQAQSRNTSEGPCLARTELRRQRPPGDGLGSPEMPTRGYVTEEELKRLLPLLQAQSGEDPYHVRSGLRRQRSSGGDSGSSQFPSHGFVTKEDLKRLLPLLQAQPTNFVEDLQTEDHPANPMVAVTAERKVSPPLKKSKEEASVSGRFVTVEELKMLLPMSNELLPEARYTYDETSDSKSTRRDSSGAELENYYPASTSPARKVSPSTPPMKKSREELPVPDPSGFMTVEDIKRLLFKTTGVQQESTGRRPGSFAGLPSANVSLKPKESHAEKRRSWAGYEVKVQPEKPGSLLVRAGPSSSTGKITKQPQSSPFVRTISQSSQPSYSDSNISGVRTRDVTSVGRAHSFSGGQRPPFAGSDFVQPMEGAGDSRERRLPEYTREDVMLGRSRSFSAPKQFRRGHSLDSGWRSKDFIPERSPLVEEDVVIGKSRGTQRVRRGNSLDRSWREAQASAPRGYQSRSQRSARHFDASSDSSASEYSTSENEPNYRRAVPRQASRRGPYQRFPQEPGYHRTDLRLRPLHDYIDSEEEYAIMNNLRGDPSREEFLRLRNSAAPGIHGNTTGIPTDNAPKRPTLSERFAEIREKSNQVKTEFEDIEDEDEDDDGSFLEGTDSLGTGPELEFDDGDYTDDKTMLVAEAIRVKKVLGKAKVADTELDTIVEVAMGTHLPEAAPISVQELRKKEGHSSKPEVDDNEQSTSVEPGIFRLKSSGEVEVVPIPENEMQTGAHNTLKVSVTQREPPDTKAISANELLKLMMNINKTKETHPKQTQQKGQSTDPHSTVKKLYFPAPQTKAASTGNIHAEKTFPGHVTQLYGNPDGNIVSQTQIGKRPARPTPQVTQSQDSLMYGKQPASVSRRRQVARSENNLGQGRYNTIGVVQARMVSSSDNVRGKKQSGVLGPENIFEEEIDCMKTKQDAIGKHTGSSDFSASGSSIDSDGELRREGRVSSVSYVGYEQTQEIETLPRVKLSAQRKRVKNRLASYVVNKNVNGNSEEDENKGAEHSRKDGHLEKAEDQRTSTEEKSSRLGQTCSEMSTTAVKNVDSNAVNENSDGTTFEATSDTIVGQIGTKAAADNIKYEDKSDEAPKKKPTGLKIRLKFVRDLSKSSTGDSCYGTDSGGSDIDKPQGCVSREPVFSNDNLPSPNSVNMFIDYKKKVKKVTSSTPKANAKQDISQLQGISPVVNDNLTEGNRAENRSPERSPSTRASSSGERSSSTYSSDDDRFGEVFGSTDTVVFVGQSEDEKINENLARSSPPPDYPSSCSLSPVSEPSPREGYGEFEQTSPRGGGTEYERPRSSMTEEEFDAQVDSIIREVKATTDIDLEGTDILDQALERVKNRLSPGSRSKAPGGLTMEAYVALHQADELQSIIEEIKGELHVLEEENQDLRNQVNSLAHSKTGEVRSVGQTTAGAVTCCDELDGDSRLQALEETNGASAQDDAITVDVFLRGFGKPVGLRSQKKTDIKLATVLVKGGSDWSGVYDAAKRSFEEHLKRVDPYSYLGLSATSMHGVETGATMWTPETLRRHTPRVEISRKRNSCVIHLRDGTNESCDALVYETLLPRTVVEDFLYQVLEHRYVILCGANGLGKSYLANQLAEHIAQKLNWSTTPAVITLTIGQTSRKELKKTLSRLMKCDIYSPTQGVPAVIVLDQLNSLASLADIFDPTQLADNHNSPFIIGVRDKSKKGPFSAKDLAVYQYFRWIQISVEDKFVIGLLDRYLRRKLSWADNVTDEEQMLDLFVWLTQVWHHINRILEEYCGLEVTLGPSVFFSCPMDIHSTEGWFGNVWNYMVIPYLHQNIRNSAKIYQRDIVWDDPTKWVIMRWPWQREKSKILPTLRKLRQVDIVLNRNQMESPKGKPKRSSSKTPKLVSTLTRGTHMETAGSLESWTTVDFQSDSSSSDSESGDSTLI